MPLDLAAHGPALVIVCRKEAAGRSRSGRQVQDGDEPLSSQIRDDRLKNKLVKEKTLEAARTRRIAMEDGESV
jgi:hypothetical protein